MYKTRIKLEGEQSICCSSLNKRGRRVLQFNDAHVKERHLKYINKMHHLDAPKKEVHNEWLQLIDHIRLTLVQHACLRLQRKSREYCWGYRVLWSERTHWRVKEHIGEDVTEAVTKFLAAEEDVDAHDAPDDDQLTSQKIMLLKSHPRSSGGSFNKKHNEYGWAQLKNWFSNSVSTMSPWRWKKMENSIYNTSIFPLREKGIKSVRNRNFLQKN